MWLLFAEATTESLPGWLGTGAGASATAILGWYAWYTATKTVPNLVDNFRDECAINRKECAEEKKEHLAAFRAELKDERTHRTDSDRCMAAAIDKLSDSIRETKQA